jgi:small subunit ribosomal protein S8
MVTDTIGDFIIRLTNAGAVGKPVVAIPFSNLKFSIAEKLKDSGYIGHVEKKGKKVKKVIEVGLKFNNGTPVIRGVKRISKPGRRLYVGAADIVPVQQGKGSLILSTPKGILTDKEARKENVGGEMLFEIW